MTIQQRALPHLIALCREVDTDCGIQLQGSLVRGEERPDSDIDLTVVLNDGITVRHNELITPEKILE